MEDSQLPFSLNTPAFRAVLVGKVAPSFGQLELSFVFDASIIQLALSYVRSNKLISTDRREGSLVRPIYAPDLRDGKVYNLKTLLPWSAKDTFFKKSQPFNGTICTVSCETSFLPRFSVDNVGLK